MDLSGGNIVLGGLETDPEPEGLEGPRYHIQSKQDDTSPNVPKPGQACEATNNNFAPGEAKIEVVDACTRQAHDHPGSAFVDVGRRLSDVSEAAERVVLRPALGCEDNVMDVVQNIKNKLLNLDCLEERDRVQDDYLEIHLFFGDPANYTKESVEEIVKDPRYYWLREKLSEVFPRSTEIGLPNEQTTTQLHQMGSADRQRPKQSLEPFRQHSTRTKKNSEPSQQGLDHSAKPHLPRKYEKKNGAKTENILLFVNQVQSLQVKNGNQCWIAIAQKRKNIVVPLAPKNDFTKYPSKQRRNQQLWEYVQIFIYGIPDDRVNLTPEQIEKILSTFEQLAKESDPIRLELKNQPFMLTEKRAKRIKEADDQKAEMEQIQKEIWNDKMLCLKFLLDRIEQARSGKTFKNPSSGNVRSYNKVVQLHQQFGDNNTKGDQSVPGDHNQPPMTPNKSKAIRRGKQPSEQDKQFESADRTRKKVKRDPSANSKKTPSSRRE